MIWSTTRSAHALFGTLLSLAYFSQHVVLGATNETINIEDNLNEKTINVQHQKSKRCSYCYTDTSRSSYTYGRQGRVDFGSACSGNPCGVNALCRESSGRPVCSCPLGYSGNPATHCIKPECLDHIDCPVHLECRNNHCSNPCENACGLNAHCEPNNHVAQCSCPAGYTGNPTHSCHIADPDAACKPSPCGVNTKCEVIRGTATCSCLPGFFGNPLSGCRHECESDYDCGPQEQCNQFKCVAACNSCGKGALCSSVSNHRAICECPKGYIGSPHVECKPECYGDVDCPSGRPACIYGICKNPCEGSCGINADCHLKGLTPVCSCPKHMTGDPFVKCRPFVPADLCSPNPCGTNAICTPGHDNTGRERPVCTCPPGYTGNALSQCVRGECQSNQECPDNKACVNYQCVNPCVGNCGSGANCDPRNHQAICTCPAGTTGDAIIGCHHVHQEPRARYLSQSACKICK